MGVDIVICDHGSLVKGSDSGHLNSVLRERGYRIWYVPRCYDGLEDIAGVYRSGAEVILADPSVRRNGNRVIDLPFLEGLEGLCKKMPVNLVLFALEPKVLGMAGILDKTDHPSIVDRIESYFIIQPS